MTIRKIAFATLLSVSALSTAQAEVYVGGQLGGSVIDDVDQSTVLTAYAGFQIPDSPFFFEGAVHDLGEAKLDNTSGEVTASGFSLMVGLRSPRTETDRLSGYLKGGQYVLETTLDTAQQPEIDEEPSGFIVAAGFDYPAAQHLYIVGEISGFVDVGFSDEFDEGITVYSMGARFEF